MSGSLNQVTLIGNLGADPEFRALGDGQEVASLRIATSESWKDRTSGERKEKTEWHSVSVFTEGLVKTIKSYLKKGAKVYVQGQLATRKWQDKDGADRYSTEIVLRGFDAKLIMLDGRSDGEAAPANSGGGQRANSTPRRDPAPAMADDDGFSDVPF